MTAVAVVLAFALAQTPEELVRQLGAEEASAREEAATALEALGEKAVAALEVGAKSDDPEVRERAGEVLRAVRTTIAVGQRLDPERLARVRAAIDDWRSRRAGPGGVVVRLDPTAYDDLLAYPDGTDKPPDPGNVVYLLAILHDPGPSEGAVEGLPRRCYLRVRAIQALRHFPIVDENEARLISILRDVLPEGDHPEGDEDERYRAQLYSEVAQITQPAVIEAMRAQTLGAMRALIPSKQTEVRRGIARALAAWEDPETVPLLSQLMHDDDEAVQWEVIRPLERRDPTPFEKPLLDVLPTIQSAHLRCIAAIALARCGRREGMDELFKIMEGTDADGGAIVACRSIPNLVTIPKETAQAGTEASHLWWKENRDRVRWDADLEMFVAE